MANDEMRDEIEELRAQVAELTAERKAKEKQQASSSKASAKKAKESVAQGTASSEPGTDETEAEKSGEDDLSSQFQELIETIDQELKDANPVTLLVVFALGVLVGRLLPR
jgi:cobalamin biosynthesis Mg chelatase CobN